MSTATVRLVVDAANASHSSKISRSSVADSSKKSTSSSSSWAIHLAISVSLALVSAAAVLWYRRKIWNPTTTNSDDDCEDDPQGQPPSKLLKNGSTTTKTTIEAQFQQCAHLVRTNPTIQQIAHQQQLLLYGWYKQSCLGDAPPYSGKFGAAFGMVDQAKWQAWDRCRGTSRDQSMQQYIQTVHTMLSLEERGNGNLSHSSNDDDDNDNDSTSDSDSYKDGPMSGNAFAPRVSRPLHLDSDTDDNEEDDDDNDDEKDESTLEAPYRHHRSWHKQLLTAAARNDASALQRLLDESMMVSVSGAGAVEQQHDEHRKTDVLINQVDASGQTALHLASDRNSVECVQLLLQHGANPCASDHDGISVLQAAVIAGHATICRLLLEYGANPDQPDNDGDTPRSCAIDDGSPELQTLFYDDDHNNDLRG